MGLYLYKNCTYATKINFAITRINERKIKGMSTEKTYSASFLHCNKKGSKTKGKKNAEKFLNNSGAHTKKKIVEENFAHESWTDKKLQRNVNIHKSVD